jgi:uncharacterized membrane protein YqaE (UPF0057 family)
VLYQPVEEREMRYLLAFLLPPVAVLLVGKPIQALLNLVLTVLGWVPGVIHALIVISNHKADKRTDKVVKALKKKQ